MASIVKKRKQFYVVYYALDENGVRKQKWEPFKTNSEAKKRKKQIEAMKTKGPVKVPNTRTLKELLAEYVSVHGVNSWAPSTFSSRTALIENYINPFIGKVKLKDINTRMMNEYYRNLLNEPAATTQKNKNHPQLVSVGTVRNVHKLLRNAFNIAVRWEIMDQNPVINCTIPKNNYKPLEIWDIDTLHKALDLCEDPILSLAMNMSFSCSLRIGELLALTWDCIDISPKSIKNNSASIYVNKEFQRVSKAALEKIGEDDIFFKFPTFTPNTTTVLVLKKPKTELSTRKVYLPETVAKLLIARKEEIEKQKANSKSEYYDYDLVMCMSNGRPISEYYIGRAFRLFIEEHDLPKVNFHSLRHTSTTYKLRLSGGDIKSVQGDTGHSQATMVTDRYAHIMDEDRRKNTEKLDRDFYKGEKPNDISDDILLLAKAIEQHPEIMKIIKALI